MQKYRTLKWPVHFVVNGHWHGPGGEQNYVTMWNLNLKNFSKAASICSHGTLPFESCAVRSCMAALLALRRASSTVASSTKPLLVMWSICRLAWYSFWALSFQHSNNISVEFVLCHRFSSFLCSPGTMGHWRRWCSWWRWWCCCWQHWCSWCTLSGTSLLSWASWSFSCSFFGLRSSSRTSVFWLCTRQTRHCHFFFYFDLWHVRKPDSIYMLLWIFHCFSSILVTVHNEVVKLT